jgi:hypothetical protein
MYSTTLLSTTIATLALLAAADNSIYAGHYFIQDTGAPLVVERLDPILKPGGVAGHVHSVVGSNTFAATMDYATTQEATCSTYATASYSPNLGPFRLS